MSKPALHLICNAHLDPVWQWQWEEGCAEALSTFRQAAELLDAHPDLIFNHNEALLYRWILQYDPELFRRIQRLVRKGRWCISGGWYLQPDVNLPGTESLIRQIMEGRRFFKEHFNARPLVAYNFDSFGHSAGLVQILVRAGYKMYIHMRPDREWLDLPSDLYRWRGIDGSEILGLRIAVGLYHTEYDNIENRIEEGIALALKTGRDVPVFWGIGDHGGGATRQDLERIDRMKRNVREVRIMHSNTERFYRAVREHGREAPVVEGGLQRIFTGCYTSLSRLKRAASVNLGLLIQTETARALAWRGTGLEYPEEVLGRAWRAHLFNDFHDILPGTCTEPAEADALGLYGYSENLLRPLRLEAVNRLKMKCMPIDAEIPLTLLSTVTGLDRFPVEVECMISHRPKWEGKWHLRLSDQSGDRVCQEEAPEALLPFNGWRRKIVFMCGSKGAGISNYGLNLERGAMRMKKTPPRLNVKWDEETGLVCSLKGPGECLQGSMLQAVAVHDRGDAWGSGLHAYRTVAGRFRPVPGSTKMSVAGPVRTLLESDHKWSHSRIHLMTCLYSEWPVVEVRIRVNWHETHKRLKLCIPTRFHSPDLFCEIPGGAVLRPADGDEYVHRRWMMISQGQDPDTQALGIVQNGAHGFDCLNGEVRFSLLRSSGYCHERGLKLGPADPFKPMDQGLHHFRFLVIPGKRAELVRKLPALADWLTQPPFALAHLHRSYGGKGAGQGNARNETLEIMPANIRLLACRRSYSGKALIIRMQERSGIESQAMVRLEDPDITIPLTFAPFQIRTVLINRAGSWKEVAMIEEN